MKTNNYNDEKIIGQLINHGHTNFLTLKELMSVKGKLNKNEYNVYYPYADATKVLLYKKTEPEIKLLQIECSNNIRHQDIMGTIFKEGLKEDSFGDIVKYNDKEDGRRVKDIIIQICYIFELIDNGSYNKCQ